MEQIGNLLTSQDDQKVFAGLCAFKGIVKRYKNTTGNDRKNLNGIAELAFPLLENQFESRLKDLNESNILILTAMVKTFHYSIFVSPLNSAVRSERQNTVQRLAPACASNLRD